jgi:ligand-binding sensor domain-containing protein
MKHLHPLAVVLLLAMACDEQTNAPQHSSEAPASQPDSATLANRLQHPPTSTEQISQYIRRIFQDRDGNMWFATTGDGVCRYDGQSLTYLTTAEGLAGNWVSAMLQDASGDLWFATGGGLSHFDGTHFNTYTTKDGLASDQVWCMLLDRSGGMWFGTEEGVSRFDGRRFTAFPLPAADLSKFPYYKYPKQINWMLEDMAGNIWFASNGGGAYRYDGKTLANFSQKEGLCDNFVQTMLEDRSGNLWFGTRHGGLCKYDGTTFTAFGRNELKGDDIWALYQDSGGTIWIAVARIGLCSYDGTTFTCYGEKDGTGIRVVQSLLEDAHGQLWIGTSNGVYKLKGGTFINWTKEDALNGR